jgi:hypothetical protein
MEGQQARTPDAAEAQVFRTTCGRQMRIGYLFLGDAQWSATRVTVAVGQCPGCRDAAMATLTVAEARRLAGALLTQATAAERSGRPAAATGPARRRRLSTAPPDTGA